MKHHPAHLFRFLCFCFLFLVVASLAYAQAPVASGFRLTKISVSGLQQYSEQEVVALSKLFPGASVTLQDLNAAASRLAQYGVFQKVTYHYQTQNNEMNLEFEVIESQELVSCKFDNFVWFTPSELNADLTRNVPLYRGSAPQSGQMLQLIEGSLVVLLKQKGVPGNVQFIPFSNGVGQPITAAMFSVSGVALPIREIHFPGASALSEDKLEKISKPLLGQDYTATEVNTFVPDTILPLYGELGYLQAHFDPAQVQLFGTNYNAPSQDVSVNVQVHEGVSYNWEGEAWGGNHVFSSDALDKLLGMRSEAVANMRKYDEGMKAVHDAYLKEGYLHVAISPQQKLDNANRHVTYDFSIDEGSRFHMGAFTVTGLSDSSARHFSKQWKLRPGDVFDGTYLSIFLKQALPDLYRSSGRFSAPIVTIYADPNTNAVNVEVAFH